MPNYEYKCKDCDSTFTVLQPIWARKKGARCPNCDSENTERLISYFSSSGGDDSCGSGGPGGLFG